MIYVEISNWRPGRRQSVSRPAGVLICDLMTCWGKPQHGSPEAIENPLPRTYVKFVDLRIPDVAEFTVGRYIRG